MNTPTTPASTPMHNESYLDNLNRYMHDGNKADVLYDHQKAILKDTAVFLGTGNKRGYIEAPTGTGKTVLFVTLAEAFSYQSKTPPKILVVTPTKDLVRQTQGGTRGDKGFAGFAPQLSVGTFYSDTPTDMRNLKSQVTITTYASLAKLAATPITVIDEEGNRRTKLINQVNDIFDIIFLDEGHKALGSGSRQIIDAIDDQTLIIGFTATPDYNASRSLQSLLPHLIHRLDLKEAITLEMLSPVVPIAIPAPDAGAQSFVTGTLGEYEHKSLRQLIYNAARNDAIVAIATTVIQAGNTPIISCIPGDTMAHPHLIAEELSQRTITQADGSQRLIRVRAVTSSISAAMRQAIYAKLENGTIDALTYIDVLTEGWDSQRANVIINARPTRSLVSARQRMGRILRTKADGRPAIAIDIVDKTTSDTAPQVSMADIFTLERIKSGTPVGAIPPAHVPSLAATIDQLTDDHDLVPVVHNAYTQYVALLETLPHLQRGQAQIKQNGKVRTFASASRLYDRYGVDHFALAQLKKQGIEIRMVRRRHEAIEAYDEQQIQEQIATLPDSGQPGYGMSIDGQRYMSINDLLVVIRQKYNQPQLHYADIAPLLQQAITVDSNVRITKKFRARTHRGVRLYTTQTMIPVRVGQTIAASYNG